MAMRIRDLFRPLFRRPFCNHTRPARQPLRAVPKLEGLECRSLPSVAAYFSGNQLVVQGDASGNTIRVDVIGSGELAQQRISYRSGGNWVVVGAYGGFDRLLINSGNGSDTVNVDAILYPTVPVTVNGNDGSDVVNFASLPRRADVNVLNTLGYTALNVVDPAGNSLAAALTMGRNSLTLAHPGYDNTYVVNYTPADLSRLSVNLGTAGGNVTVQDTFSNSYSGTTGTFINTPSSGSPWSTTVRATSGPLAANTPGLFNQVTIGSAANTLDPIQGAVTLNGGYGEQLSIQDQGASAAQTWTLTRTSVNRSGSAPILLGTPIGTQVYGGRGGNTFFAQGFSGAIYTGAGSDTVNVGTPGNTLTGLGTLGIYGQAGVARINLNGQGATTAETDTFGKVLYDSFSTTGTTVYYANISGGLFLNGGSGGNTIDVQATEAATPVTINPGGGVNRLAFGSTSDTLSTVLGPVTVNGSDSDTLAFNDQGTTADRTFVLDTGSVTWGGPAINYAGVQSVTVNGGSGTNVYFVYGSPAEVSTTLNGGPGVNAFVEGAYVNPLLGPLAVHGRPGSNSYLVYSDDPTPTAQTYTLTADTLTRSGLAPVTFDNLYEVILYPAPVGGNTINVTSLAAGVFANLVAASGDTVTIGSNQSLAAVLGPVSVTAFGTSPPTVVLDDSADTTPPAGPLTLSNDTTYGYHITGLIPPDVYLRPGENANVNATLLLGAGDKTISVQGPPVGVALTLDAGSGNNTLVGNSAAGNLWSITGPNSGTVAVGYDSANPALTFRDVQNLTGSATVADCEKFWIYTGGSVAGNLQAPTNAGDLAYLGSPYYVGSVVVDLRTGVATGVGGTVSGVNTVYGSPGANEPGLYNLLIGNGGCYLYGGVGRRNILVAGAAASNLYGGGANDEDLLIAGSTAYDAEAGLASWQQIAAYWAGTDDHDTRAANLQAGAGVPLLDATTVVGNGGGNSLIGGGSWALIYTDGLDAISGFDPSSQQTTIAP